MRATRVSRMSWESMMDRMSTKVAIVTGGARGLGEAIARLLAAEGANVVIADIIDTEGTALAAEIGDRARYEHLDVRSESEWQRVVAAAEAAFGPVSVLVNNAGVSGFSPIEAYSEDEYRRVIDINQVGVFLGMKSVFASMQRAGGGSIVNMSSASGLIGKPFVLAYTAAKFAVRGMTKVAAVEFGPHNIRVNSVHPGIIRTAMVVDPEDPAPGSLHPVIKGLLQTLPAGRVGEPLEIAHMVLSLASDEIRYATGAEFIVDGGLTCE